MTMFNQTIIRQTDAAFNNDEYSSKSTTNDWLGTIKYNIPDLIWFDLLCLTPLSAIFQLYHGDQS